MNKYIKPEIFENEINMEDIMTESVSFGTEQQAGDVTSVWGFWNN